MRAANGVWIGWPGSAGPALGPFEADGMPLVGVGLSEDEVAEFYEGFCNATLWPLYHDVIVPPVFHRPWWESYVVVNQRFAWAAAEQAAAGATVWVNDYQLQLVPAMLRAIRADVRIGFFNHIPFPGYEIFAQLPWRRQIIDGLLGADLVGFQRHSDTTNFLRACRRGAGRTTRGSLVRVPGPAGVREVRAAAFPVSIDAASFGELASRDDVRARAREIREAIGDPDVVLLGVDRLDYTKGIRHRLDAYSELLDEGRLQSPGAVLIQVASPSRERVEQYRLLRDEIEVTVGRINGDHGELGSTPVLYLHQSYPREEMAALYLAADVMLVTALRDGMNLVAKEFVACRNDDDRHARAQRVHRRGRRAGRRLPGQPARHRGAQGHHHARGHGVARRGAAPDALDAQAGVRARRGPLGRELPRCPEGFVPSPTAGSLSMTDQPATATDLAAPPQIPEVMRAAVLFGPRDIRVVDRPVPAARARRGAGQSGDVRHVRDRPEDLRRPFPADPAVRGLHARPRVDRHGGGARPPGGRVRGRRPRVHRGAQRLRPVRQLPGRQVHGVPQLRQPGQGAPRHGDDDRRRLRRVRRP